MEKSESLKFITEKKEKGRKERAEKARVRYFINDDRIIETDDKAKADYVIYSSIDREVESISLLKSNTLSIGELKRLAGIIVDMEHTRKMKIVMPPRLGKKKSVLIEHIEPREEE